MIPAFGRLDGRQRAAAFAHDRRLELGLTQAEVAVAAGVKDVKTIRNVETGRNWPSDLTRRGIETALRLAIGTLDRIAAGENPGDNASDRSVTPERQSSTPAAQELIDLSAAIARLSQVHEAVLRRGDMGTAERVRTLIDAISALMGSYGSSVEPKLAAWGAQRDSPS